MDAGDLHVVFGTGQIGAAVAARLAEMGARVRAISRHRPARRVHGVEWRSADVTDKSACRASAAGAAVIYQCLNAPYTRWPEQFPLLQARVLGAAEQNHARLVSLENVYGYGPTGGAPMTEDLPAAAGTIKGSVRAAMTQELLQAHAAGRVQIAIGRAADFFGAGVTASTLGERVFANALAGRPVDFLGNPALLHTYSYAQDVAAGLVVLGTDERALGQVWHLPGPETASTYTILDLIASEVGLPVRIRRIPKVALKALQAVSPMMRGLAEMSYQFEQPFVMDTSKFEQTFGMAGTPLVEAIRETVSWYALQRVAA